MGAHVLLFLLALAVTATQHSEVSGTEVDDRQLAGNTTDAVADAGPGQAGGTTESTDIGSTEAAAEQAPPVRRRRIDWDIALPVLDFYNYFISTVVCVAIVCNFLSLVVFASKGPKERTVNMLLMALTISDTLSLCSLIDYATFYWSDYTFSLQQKTDLGCRLIQYVTNVGRDCSSYIILTFTVDRFVAVWFPLNRASIMTKKRVKMALVVILILSAAAEIYMPILLEYSEVTRTCSSYDDALMSRYSSAFRNVLGFMVPGVAVAILNALIVRRLRKYQARRSTMTGAGTGASGESQNRSLTVMLVTVSTFSFACFTPKLIFFFCLAFGDYQGLTPFFVSAYLTDALATLNYACNFFFYVLSGSQFRQDFVKAFLKMCGRQVGGRSNSTKTATSNVWSSQTHSKTGRPSVNSEIDSAPDQSNRSGNPVTSSNETLDSSVASHPTV